MTGASFPPTVSPCILAGGELVAALSVIVYTSLVKIVMGRSEWIAALSGLTERSDMPEGLALVSGLNILADSER